MKTFKKIASVAIAATMLTSSLGFSVVNAATATDTVGAEVQTTLKSEVQDGVILHAFNWSYNSIRENLAAIAAAGYTTVQTSPVQQPKDYGSSNDVVGQWWKLYQPVSMQIAKDSWLGTRDDLKALCTEAEKYGVKIICDIVSNHMGNEIEDDPNSLSEQVKTYQPDFYENKSTYFRNNTLTAADSMPGVVTGHLSACPDLNTGNDNVQAAVVSLLKDCIDCGVDGFRFDAAKHIETPDDGANASDYWSTISTEAGKYYNQKTGGNLFIYGEILNQCGNGRKFSSYTKYINVTDNKTGDAVLYNVVQGNASTAANPAYKSGVAASDVVLWAESHDTYEGTSGSSGLSNTQKVSDENIVKAWAIVASRKDSTALYFARPGAALMGDAATNTTYKSTAVAEINKFHNLFTGQSETLGASGDIAYVARGGKGVVLVNTTGTTANASVSGTGLADGSYIDTITGNKFTVSGGVVTGTIGETGVAVVYAGSTTPRNTVSVESGDFEGETMTVTLGLENATSGTYCLENGTPVAYTGTTTIRIGSDYNYGETINLTVTATDGTNSTTTTYKYTKNEAATSGVYIFFNAAKRTNWKAPFNVYIYDEETSETETYANASWPGQPMLYDEASGYYYVEIADTCYATDKDGNVTESNFNLATSEKSCVIFSDGSSVNSAPRQYPTNGSKTKLRPKGQSMLFCGTSTTSWTATDLKPTADNVEATDVTKGEVEPTTEPTTAPQPTSTDPTESTFVKRYGDVDLNGRVNVVDGTIIQKYGIGLIEPSEIIETLGDVNQDKRISVIDTTIIQKYAIGLNTEGSIAGQVYEEPATEPATEPTTEVPTTEAPTTEPTTAAPTTEPTTAPAPETYTLYFKTTLGWMTSDGVSLFAYDNATGNSYFLEINPDAYPNVYTAEVPMSVNSVIIYRYLDEVSEKPVGGDSGNVYNTWTANNVSSKNDCITLSPDEVVSVGPYVEETAPEFALDRVYFDNSVSKWAEVYIYGWSESMLGNSAVKMTQIEGTDIWYYDFDEPLMPGSKCFLFKNTETTWSKQTNDVTVVENMNCYKPKSTSTKPAYSWSFYTE